MTIEKKIIEILKTRDMQENIKIIMKTDTTRMIIELATKTKIGINIDTSAEMRAMTKLEVGLEKDFAYLRKGKLMTSQRLNKSTKSYES